MAPNAKVKFEEKVADIKKISFKSGEMDNSMLREVLTGSYRPYFFLVPPPSLAFVNKASPISDLLRFSKVYVRYECPLSADGLESDLCEQPIFWR